MLNQAPILYQRASNLTILGGLLLIGVSAYLGRIPVFLFLNTDGGAIIDQFFKWTTWGAEGWVWIPYLIVLVTWFKKEDRNRKIFLDKVLGLEYATVNENLEILLKTYCAKIGIEFMQNLHVY